MSAINQRSLDGAPAMITLEFNWVERTKDLINDWPPLAYQVPTSTDQSHIYHRVKEKILSILSLEPGMAYAQTLLGFHINLDPTNTSESFRYRAWRPEDPLSMYLKPGQDKLTGDIHVYLFQDLDFPYRATQIYDVLKPHDWIYTPLSATDHVSRMRFHYHTVERIVAIGRTKNSASSASSEQENVVVIKYFDDYEGINVETFFVVPWTPDGRRTPGHNMTPIFFNNIVVTVKEFKELAFKKLRDAVSDYQDAVYVGLVREGKIMGAGVNTVAGSVASPAAGSVVGPVEQE
ncbi:hypothetical protein K490DRAFT_63800 [Saccharata proteae CBS 121410]|uniref:Uncharacterized protein n=1 Tax=Saccharata proteae CBS 121410 TaxID=1314787 RepID=A0A6A5YE93_9PEZI|nr:hypothetical protein K490DRAFT_63800 [Saccharata proteae CBS 121410]